MHPAFSVIFFTTASGAGFGLFAWIGMMAAMDGLPNRVQAGVALVVGALFAVAGLFSSVAHLGQPTRAWRAFSQWRSSWLSREGVLALACLFVALCLGGLLWAADPAAMGQSSMSATGAMRILGGLLTALSLATIACTAMIYASLKPIPAWRHPLVLPVYLGFALATGYLLTFSILGLTGMLWNGHQVATFMLAGALLLLALKTGAWRFVDGERAPISRNSALGLPHARPVQVFERPHTEANYLLKEMGYVLARKHAGRLRAISAVLFTLVPAAIAMLLWLWPAFEPSPAWLCLAFLSTMAGALVERWLFFAEARHLVTLYY